VSYEVLRLVRPPLNVLALGLGLVLERFAYLLLFGASVHQVCTSEGLVVLGDHTNRVCGVAATVSQRE
jgi:hypothetical protein